MIFRFRKLRKQYAINENDCLCIVWFFEIIHLAECLWIGTALFDLQTINEGLGQKESAPYIP